MMDFPEPCRIHAKKEWNGWKITCPWCQIKELRSQLNSARVEIRRLMAIEVIYKRAYAEVEKMNKDIAEGKI
jgi:hypothetical protein